MNKKPKILIKKEQLQIIVDRLCYQLIEHHGDFKQTCIVGIQKKGAILAERVLHRLNEIGVKNKIPFGKLDITFFRDDFRQGNKILVPHDNSMEFLVDELDVILVDDVLYSGRTIQAALQALTHYGRARSVELLVLIDRRFNRCLPIQGQYIGLKVDSLDQAYVKVELEEEGLEDRVLFFDADNKA